MKALTFALLAGCAHSEPTARTLPTLHAVGATSAVPAAHYAGIFDDGRVWKYRVETLGSSSVVTTVTCTAEVVRSTETEIASRIRCDRPLTNSYVADTIPTCGELIEGEWIANHKGLSRYVAPNAGCFQWNSDHETGLMLSANPVPSERVREDPDGGCGRASIVERHDDVWCATYAAWCGDESVDTFCFSRDGIVAGKREFSAGQQIRFCLNEHGCKSLLH